MGVPAADTVTVVFAGLVQGVLEVKVSMTGPLSPTGSKVEPLTPGPLQLPLGNPGSCKVVRSRGGSVSQRLAGLRLGIAGVVILIVAFAGLVQGVLGVKVSTTAPFCPFGLKVVPLTPGPLQVPLGKPGSCKVVRSSGRSVAQRVAVPRMGVVGTLTVMVVLAGKAQEAAGVKVREILPVCPAGLNVAPLTPGPDQVPLG